MFEQIARIRRTNDLRAAAVSDRRAGTRQHDKRRGEIQTQGRRVHPLDLATFTPDVSAGVLNLIFRNVIRFRDK